MLCILVARYVPAQIWLNLIFQNCLILTLAELNANINNIPKSVFSQ